MVAICFLIAVLFILFSTYYDPGCVSGLDKKVKTTTWTHARYMVSNGVNYVEVFVY